MHLEHQWRFCHHSAVIVAPPTSAKKSRGPTPLTTESNNFIEAVDAAMKIWELAARAVGAPAACYPPELQWPENEKQASVGSSNATI